MELEERVNQHDRQLQRHDKEIARMNDNIVEIQKDLNNGLARVDESNRFLREQNTRQSEQNSEILQAVLNRNDKNEERKHELKMLNWSNVWKIVGIASGASGVISVIIQLIFG